MNRTRGAQARAPFSRPDDLDLEPAVARGALEEVERAHGGPLEEVVGVPPRFAAREPHARAPAAARDEVRLPAADEPLEAVDVSGHHRERLAGLGDERDERPLHVRARRRVTVLFV